jgi:hypothetical protein
MNVSPVLPFQNAQELSDELQQRGVSLCLIQWVKPSGELIGCWVPLPHLTNAIEAGVCVERSFLSKYSSDISPKVLRADPKSCRVFGCLDGFAHLVSESYFDKRPDENCARSNLRAD